MDKPQDPDEAGIRELHWALTLRGKQLELDFPAGWDELVAKGVYLPEPDMFIDWQKDWGSYEPSEVAQTAAKAMHSSPIDIVELMKCLAIAQISDAVRYWMGDAIYHELLLHASDRAPHRPL